MSEQIPTPDPLLDFLVHDTPAKFSAQRCACDLLECVYWQVTEHLPESDYTVARGITQTQAEYISGYLNKTASEQAEEIKTALKTKVSSMTREEKVKLLVKLLTQDRVKK